MDSLQNEILKEKTPFITQPQKLIQYKDDQKFIEQWIQVTSNQQLFYKMSLKILQENPSLNQKFEDISENIEKKQLIIDILSCMIDIITNDNFSVDTKIILFLETKRILKKVPQILTGNILIQILGFDPLKYFFNNQSSLQTEALIQSYWKLVATITTVYHSYLFENGFNCIHDFRGVFEDENGIKLITKIGNMKRIAQTLCGHILRKLLLGNNYYWIIPKQISKIIFGRNRINYSYHFFCFYLNYFFILKYNFQKIPCIDSPYWKELNQIVDDYNYNSIDDDNLLTIMNNINGYIQSVKNFNEYCRPVVDTVLRQEILNPFWKTKFQKDKQQKILIGYQKMIYDAIDQKDTLLLQDIFYQNHQDQKSKIKYSNSLHYINLNHFIWLDENVVIYFLQQYYLKMLDMWVNFKEEFYQQQFGNAACCLNIFNLFFSVYSESFSQQIKIEYISFIEKQISLNNLLFTERGHNLIQQVTFINNKELSIKKTSYIQPILDFLFQVLQDDKIFSILNSPDELYQFILAIYSKLNECNSVQSKEQIRVQKVYIDYEITELCLKIMNQLNCLISHQPFKQFLSNQVNIILSRIQNSINITSDELCVLKFIQQNNIKERYNLEFTIKSEWIFKQLELIPLRQNFLENVSWISVEFQYLIQILKNLTSVEGKKHELENYIQLYRLFKQELRIFPQTKQLFILPLLIEQIKLYHNDWKIKYYINLINIVFEDLQIISKLHILNMIVQNICKLELWAITILIFFQLDKEKIIRKRVRQIKNKFQEYFSSLEEFDQINSINFFIYLLINILPYQKTPYWKKSAYLFRQFCGFFVNIGKINLKRQAQSFLQIKQILNILNHCKSITDESVNFNIQIPMLDESKEFKILQLFPELKEYEDNIQKPVIQTQIIDFLNTISEEFFRIKRKGMQEYLKQIEPTKNLIDRNLFLIPNSQQ